MVRWRCKEKFKEETGALDHGAHVWKHVGPSRSDIGGLWEQGLQRAGVLSARLRRMNVVQSQEVELKMVSKGDQWGSDCAFER